MIQVLQFFFRRLLINPSVPLRVIILLGAVLLYGTTGYLYFELPENPDLTWAEGLWYTIVTMTTVGYGDYFPKTMGGRFLVGLPVMGFGIGLLGYTLSVVAMLLITSKSKEIKGMSSFTSENHVVIFNFPGLAKINCLLDEFAGDSAFNKNTQVVLVDEFLEELPPELQKRGVHYVRGNPIRDETLERAAIDTAGHAVILCRDAGNPASDNLNMAIALAVEGRKRKIFTVVECVEEASVELLKKTRCDQIVCTSRFQAYYLSQELLNRGGVQDVVADMLSVGKRQQKDADRQQQKIYITNVDRDTTFGELARRCREKQHLAIGVITAQGVCLNLAESAPVQKSDRLITIGAERIIVN